MLILPAIDVRGGNCVRLFQGKAEQETIYSDDPLKVANEWKIKGAQMLHVVDLDGAFEGKPINLPLIGTIRREIGIPIEVGGGFRDMKSISKAIEQGIDRVILGSAAIHNPQLVADGLREFGPAVTVSVDVSGAFATAAGWKEVTAMPYSELVGRLRDLGLKQILFTDTKRDGTLLGPDVAVVKQFLETAKLPTVVSGGITSLDDVFNMKQLESQGLEGIVIGKALYDKKIQLEDALRLA
jgi:phosphoribosylformimino-5-aminoimidazole carboxamide ribotide isomerase